MVAGCVPVAVANVVYATVDRNGPGGDDADTDGSGGNGNGEGVFPAIAELAPSVLPSVSTVRFPSGSVRATPVRATVYDVKLRLA
jgi:hypothetical protein